MEEIKEGEYVRLSRNQGINKIIEIEYDGFLILDDIIADEWGEPTDRISPEDIDKEILKHSFNIIDLIEVGDYVNGAKVIRIDCGCYVITGEKSAYSLNKSYTDYQINSIVTKEQFESIEYKVGD